MTRPGGTVITPAVLREWPLPGVEGGKESRGRAVVVGGSVQNPGALILAAEASLRAGAGKSQVVAPDPVAVPIGVAMPEALVQGGPVAGSGDLAPGASGFVAELCPEAEAVLIGPGLGVSGSGDVKAGIVLGLCARGADPAQAAVWGAYLHGAIGGRLASRYGPYGYLSRELPAEIPQALLEVAR